ncbi:MAG: hypothetical protein LBG17_07850 [Bacteroidales bacterium]|nr:hypothetical protein [Bacteroidales bacterium]
MREKQQSNGKVGIVYIAAANEFNRKINDLIKYKCGIKILVERDPDENREALFEMIKNQEHTIKIPFCESLVPQI